MILLKPRTFFTTDIQWDWASSWETWSSQWDQHGRLRHGCVQEFVPWQGYTELWVVPPIVWHACLLPHNFCIDSRGFLSCVFTFDKLFFSPERKKNCSCGSAQAVTVGDRAHSKNVWGPRDHQTNAVNKVGLVNLQTHTCMYQHCTCRAQTGCKCLGPQLFVSCQGMLRCRRITLLKSGNCY